MSELRRSYFTDEYVIINSARSRRLAPFKGRERAIGRRCPLCAGADMEGVRVLKYDDGLVSAGNSEPREDNGPFGHTPNLGEHFLVADTDHAQTFQRESISKLSRILLSLQETGRALHGKKGVEYSSIFFNNGSDLGTRTSHPAFEILTLSEVPPAVLEEMKAVDKSMYDLGVCPMCRVLSVETGGPRQILSTTNYIAFAPWAATHSFEFWIYPKAHQLSFLRVSQSEIYDLSMIMRSTLGGLFGALGDVPFTLIIHNTPQGRREGELHWHIEVCPQVKRFAGLERGMRVFINEVSPEESAEILGKAARKELAELVGVT